MDMAMIRDLAHHVVDDEFVDAVLLARDHRERIDHERALLFGGRRAMLSKHRHRRIAGIAIEDREFERNLELAVPRSVLLQFTEIAFRHDRDCTASGPGIVAFRGPM